MSSSITHAYTYAHCPHAAPQARARVSAHATLVSVASHTRRSRGSLARRRQRDALPHGILGHPGLKLLSVRQPSPSAQWGNPKRGMPSRDHSKVMRKPLTSNIVCGCPLRVDMPSIHRTENSESRSLGIRFVQGKSTSSEKQGTVGWHHLSQTTRLMRPHLLCFRRVKDHHDSIHHSPSLKKHV